jgi:hypothetical protein
MHFKGWQAGGVSPCLLAGGSCPGCRHWVSAGCAVWCDAASGCDEGSVSLSGCHLLLSRGAQGRGGWGVQQAGMAAQQLCHTQANPRGCWGAGCSPSRCTCTGVPARRARMYHSYSLSWATPADRRGWALMEWRAFLVPLYHQPTAHGATAARCYILPMWCASHGVGVPPLRPACGDIHAWVGGLGVRPVASNTIGLPLLLQRAACCTRQACRCWDGA